MIIYPTLEHLSNGEIKAKLNAAPLLMDYAADQIIKHLISVNNNYEPKTIILKLMFESGIWQSFLSQGQTNTAIIKYIRKIKYDENTIVNGLNQITLSLKRIYVDEAPYHLDNIICEWELFFLVSEQIALQEWEYDLKKNALYPVINTWLTILRSAFSSYQLSLRKNILPGNYGTGNSDEILTKMPPTIIERKPFADYLIHPQKEELAVHLKEQFRGERGKGIKIMLEVLSRNEPPLISFMYGQGAALHNAIETYFGYDIGSYQSINGYQITAANDGDVEAATIKLNQVLSMLT